MTAGGRIGRDDKPSQRRPIDWVDPRHHRLSGWAFTLNRLTGLGLAAYLYLHLVVLSLLARGPSDWDGFVRLATSPAVLALDLVLLAGLLIHALNGIRVALVGLGLVVRRQQAMFVVLMIVAAILFAVAAMRILELI